MKSFSGIRITVAALVCAALGFALAGCLGGDTETVTVTETTAGGNDFETALQEKLEGVKFDCGDQELPPADGKSITCQASDDEGAKGELKLSRKGDAVSYSLQLNKPGGGVRIKGGVLGADGGPVSLTPQSGGSSDSGSGGVPSGGY